jgi:hypothetical protein
MLQTIIIIIIIISFKDVRDCYITTATTTTTFFLGKLQMCRT